MTEIHPPYSSERFQDDDPYQEQLRLIDRKFKELAERNKETGYRREADVVLDTETNDTALVILETTGGSDNIDRSVIRIKPLSNLVWNEHGRLVESDTIFIFQKTDDAIRARFVPAHIDRSPKDSLAPLLEKDLPAGIDAIVMGTARSLFDDGVYDSTDPVYEVKFSDQRYIEAWQALEARFDGSGVPFHVSSVWSSEAPTDFMAPPSADMLHVSLEAVRTNDSFVVTSANLQGPGYFYNRQSDEEGTVTHIFHEQSDYEQTFSSPSDEELGQDEDSDMMHELLSEEQGAREEFTLDRAKKVLRALEDLLAKIEQEQR